MRLNKAAIIIVAILTVIFQSLWANDPVIPGGLTGPRVLAMGGSGVAMPGCSISSTVNPATLVFVDWTEISAGYGKQDTGDQRVWYVSGTMPLISRLVSQFTVFSLYDLNQTDYEHNSYNFTLAFPLSPNGKLLTGISGKFLQVSIPGITGIPSGGGVDLGLLLTVWEGIDSGAFRLGVSMIDAQSVVKIDGQGYTLPSVYRYGLSWHLNENLIANLEFDSQNSIIDEFESYGIFRLGMEYSLNAWSLKGLAFRTGYFQKLQSEGTLSAGIGAGYGDWRIDYSMQIPVALYNANHNLSVSWGPGRKDPQKVFVQLPESQDKSEKEPKDQEYVREDHLSIFSALDLAVGADRDFMEFSPSRRSDRVDDEKKDQTKKQEQESKARSTAESRRVPVPEGPAAQEKVRLGVELEMPASFSSYLSKSSDQYSILKEDLRLHAVNNPFSPNNDGKKDKTIFVGRLVNERLNVNRWRLYILREGSVVRSFSGGSSLPRNLEWDGRDENNRMMDDGIYAVVLRVLDANGMELASATENVEVRTKSKSVEIDGPSSVLLTGEKSDKDLVFKIPRILGSSDWRFTIYNPSGQRIFEQRASGQVPEELKWGTSGRGPAAAAGKYQAILRYRDDLGLASKSETSFMINYAQFSTSIKANPSIFKPDSQGGKAVTFGMDVRGQVKLKSWKLQIIDQNSNQEVNAFSGSGNPPAIINWDGRSKDNKPVDGGRIFVGRLLVMTELGTKSALDSDPIQSEAGVYTGEKALSINLVRVLFENGQHTLTEKGEQDLAKAANTVTQYKMDYQLQITGHTDEKEGNDKAGLELSRKRAQTVADYLIKKGHITAERIHVIGQGSKTMLSQSENSDDRIRNRRVEVLLFAK